MLTLFRTFNLRYLAKHKLRTTTIIFGVTLGIIMVAATALVNQSILRSYRSLVDTAAGKTDLQVLSNTRSGLPASIADEVAQIKGVKAAVPVVRSDVFAFINGKQAGSLLVYGIDRKKDTNARSYEFSAGRQFRAGEPDAIVLTKAWANEKGLKTGDHINITGSRGFKEFKIVGLLSDTGPAHTNLGSFAVMDIDTARELLNKAGKIDQVDVVLESNEKPNIVQKRIKDRLGGRAEVEIPATRGTEVQRSMESMSIFLDLAAMISLFVGAFIIFNNLEISVEERRYGIGTLRALGLPRKKIFTLVIFEAILLGFIGSIFGVAIGTLLANLMSTAFADAILSFERIRITDLGVTPQIFVLGILMGPVMAAIASMGPAMRMLKVSPLEALRPFETAWRPRPKTWKLVVSALILIIGVGSLLIFVYVLENNDKLSQNIQLIGNFILASIFLTFLGSVLLMPHLLSIPIGQQGSRSFTLRMAIDNLRRAPGRTAATITGMMVAVTMMVTMSGVVGSIMIRTMDILDKMIGWDLLVEANVFGSSGGVPLTENFGKKLAKIDGVDVVTAETFNSIRFNGYNVQLITLDMSNYFKWSRLDLKEGRQDQVCDDLKKGGSIIVNTEFAKKFGYKKGQKMTLNTPTGKVKLKIAGIFNYLTQEPGGVIIMGRSDYKKYWNDDSVDSFAIVVIKGQNANAVANKIQASFAKNYGVKVREASEFKNSIRALIDKEFSLTDMLIYIAIIVAAFGIINSSLITILQRSRELSIVRALGARRRQVRHIILNESVIMGLIGAALGSILGISLGKLMVLGDGIILDMPIKYYMPWITILGAFAISLGMTAVGSSIPARAALKREIVEGISYE